MSNDGAAVRPVMPQVRIVRSPAKQLIAALEQAARENEPAGGGLGEQIHFIRVHAKRARALLELFRPHISKQAFAASKSRIRAPAAILAALRDEKVIQEALDTARAELRKGQREQFRQWFSMEDWPASRRMLLAAREKLRSAVASLPAPRGKGPASLVDFVKPGLKRTYSRARGAMRQARKAGTAEERHRWRIWVKRVQLELELIEAAGVRINRKFIKAFDRLQRLLGDERDLRLALAFAERQDHIPLAVLKTLRRKRRLIETKIVRSTKRILASGAATFVRKTVKQFP